MSSSSSPPDEEDVPQQAKDPSEVFVVKKERQCSVCATDRPSDGYPVEPITSACTHTTTDVCKECMRTYIASELSSRVTAVISCPVCEETMSYFDVMRNAAPEDFNRYDERVTIESLQNEPDFRWCPQPGCPGGQIQAFGDAEPIVTCNHCQQRFCFTHRVPWHISLTCKQYDETPELARQVHEGEAVAEEEENVEGAAEDDKLAASLKAIEEQESTAQERERRNSEVRKGEAYVQNIAKRCPNCDSPTERVDGCKHMTFPIGVGNAGKRGLKVTWTITAHINQCLTLYGSVKEKRRSRQIWQQCFQLVEKFTEEKEGEEETNNNEDEVENEDENEDDNNYENESETEDENADEKLNSTGQ